MGFFFCYYRETIFNTWILVGQSLETMYYMQSFGDLQL